MPRYAKRRDESEPDIVDALKKAGCLVYRELPVDLLVRNHCDPPGVMRVIECKTPTKTGKRRNRKDQEAQDEFIRATGTPYAMTAEEALKAVGK